MYMHLCMHIDVMFMTSLTKEYIKQCVFLSLIMTANFSSGVIAPPVHATEHIQKLITQIHRVESIDYWTQWIENTIQKTFRDNTVCN